MLCEVLQPPLLQPTLAFSLVLGFARRNCLPLHIARGVRSAALVAAIRSAVVDVRAEHGHCPAEGNMA